MAKKLSQKEAQELREAFDVADKDKNGFVTKKELRELLLKSSTDGKLDEGLVD